MIKSKQHNFITSAEAAKILGFTADYVRKLILKGVLKGDKLGRNWIINLKDLKGICRQRHPQSGE
jgi:excisionase family DNA binding protein